MATLRLCIFFSIFLFHSNICLLTFVVHLFKFNLLLEEVETEEKKKHFLSVTEVNLNKNMDIIRMNAHTFIYTKVHRHDTRSGCFFLYFSVSFNLVFAD